MKIVTILLTLALLQVALKPKPTIYFYPESSYTSAFKVSFLRVCENVGLSEKVAESKYKAEVGNIQNKFTWILRDRNGKILSMDERSSMDDAGISLCKAVKNP